MSDHGLVLKADQDFWSDSQIAALSQLGLSRASKGDLQVFFHQSQRTGLDPFARQIYMIERGGRYTIQTSIDGFRIVAQRSGNYGGQTMAEWCGTDGVWKDIWLESTPPVAARIGVYYKGSDKATYASAKWDSYANPSSPIWKKMPDLMLAKCAEALALRKAFPNDLSGVYTTEEMNQADAVEKKPESAFKAKTPALHIEPAVVIFTEEETKYIKDVFNEVKTITDIDQLREIWSEDKKYLDVNIDGITLKDLISNRVAELKAVTPAVEVTE
jgi:phage recombination protein Bet